jgi:hypothetical protein
MAGIFGRPEESIRHCHGFFREGKQEARADGCFLS